MMERQVKDRQGKDKSSFANPKVIDLKTRVQLETKRRIEQTEAQRNDIEPEIQKQNGCAEGLVDRFGNIFKNFHKWTVYAIACIENGNEADALIVLHDLKRMFKSF